MKSYKDIDTYQMAYKLAWKVHEMTMTLPKYELYEQGSQIRRSTKSIKNNIAEACLPVRQGFGRRRYKDEFIRFLIFAHSSCDEALTQLQMISDIHFKDNPLSELIEEYDILGRKINKFIQYVINEWKR